MSQSICCAWGGLTTPPWDRWHYLGKPDLCCSLEQLSSSIWLNVQGGLGQNGHNLLCLDRSGTGSTAAGVQTDGSFLHCCTLTPTVRITITLLIREVYAVWKQDYRSNMGLLLPYFALPLHVSSRSQSPAELKVLSWASSEKHKRIVQTRLISGS